MSIHMTNNERHTISAQQRREIDAAWRARHGNPFRLVKNPFQDIPISSFLLLLSPYLHFNPPDLPTAPGTDPFESLGRSFGEFQDEVKHIPYIARKGLAQIHRDHIPFAGGVIVIVCESSLSANLGSGRLDDESDQLRFAEQVSSIATPHDIPHILLLIGVTERRIWFAGSQIRINSWNELETVADLLYDI